MSSGSSYDGELLALLYDSVPSYQSRKDFPFYLGQAEKCRGHVLELGCGSGRVLVPLAKAGVQITGVDNSKEMLARCKKKIEEAGDEITSETKLIQASMTEFLLEEKASLVLTPFRAFQHLINVEDQKKCLKCVYNSLEDDGTLILDLFKPNMKFIANVDPKVEIHDFDGVEVEHEGTKLLVRRTLRITKADTANQVNQCEIAYYVANAGDIKGKTSFMEKRIVQEFPLRFFFRYEIEYLLELCGFVVKNVYGDYEGNSFDSESTEMIVVARKRTE